MTVTQEDSALLTVAEVALMLRVSKMTIYRLIHLCQFDGEGGEKGAIRVGRSFRVHLWAAKRYLKTGGAL
jgi:excisionase family DNA binding protein